MKLTRRDALAALGSLGAGSVAGCTGVSPPTADAPGDRPDGPDGPDTPSGDLDDDVVASIVAAAEVLYPSGVEGVPEFVETYALGRVADRPRHRAGLAETVRDLDALARDWTGSPFAELSPERRDGLLRDVGADQVESDPDGPLPERLRFFVVNDLLYALYASPTGGRLVGIENPIGYPGGTESYQRPPPGDAGGGDG